MKINQLNGRPSLMSSTPNCCKTEHERKVVVRKLFFVCQNWQTLLHLLLHYYKYIHYFQHYYRSKFANLIQIQIQVTRFSQITGNARARAHRGHPSITIKSLKCNNIPFQDRGLSMIQGQGQTTPHNTPVRKSQSYT